MDRGKNWVNTITFWNCCLAFLYIYIFFHVLSLIQLGNYIFENSTIFTKSSTYTQLCTSPWITNSCSFLFLMNQKQRSVFPKVLGFRILYFICWNLWVLRLFMQVFRLIGPKFWDFLEKSLGSLFFPTSLYNEFKYI